jgi:hypothetical protein
MDPGPSPKDKPKGKDAITDARRAPADQVMGVPDDHALSPARRARCSGGLGPARSPRISSDIADANDLVEFTLLKAYVGADSWTMRPGC